MRSILTHLFPAFAGHSHYNDDSLLRSLRVGHEKIFPRYFTMALAEDDISQADLNTVLDNLGDARTLARVCTTLQQRGLLEPIFERLDAYKGTLDANLFPGMITALCDVGDMLPEEPRVNVLNFDALTHAWRLIFFGLQNLPEEEQRFRHLETGMEASHGVRLPVQLASHEERTGTREEHSFLVNEDHSQKLKATAVERVRNAAADGRLRKMAGLKFILYRWLNWSGPDEPKEWLVGQIQNIEDAIWTLRTFVDVIRSESAWKVQYTRYIILNELERFADIAQLENQTSKLDVGTLNQTDQRALRAFRQALVWKAEGKPDDYGRNGRLDKNPLTEDS